MWIFYKILLEESNFLNEDFNSVEDEHSDINDESGEVLSALLENEHSITAPVGT